MNAVPKQIHCDFFLRPHVAGRAFHTNVVVYNSGSICSLVCSQILMELEGGRIINVMKPRKNIDTQNKLDPNKHAISDKAYSRR